MALYFIKDTTLTGIADAIRSKTGTSDPIAVTDMATKISEITGGGDTTTTVFEEQELSFSLNSSMGFFGAWGEGMFTLEDGKEYIVTWDGTEHRCTAYSGDYLGAGKTAYFLGNKEFLEAFVQGQTINPKEPFVIYQLLSNGYNGIMTFSNEASHRVGISKAPAIGGDHTVTFMSEDGQTVLGTKPVMNGDTCGNPITLGLFDIPTKESTAQYHYTFNGWSLTAGGDADSNALVNVTEDRTVYVAFKADTRAYVIRFFDGDTVLKTMVCEYGTTPSYTPEKEGSTFLGWQPEVTTVTGDADYYSQWESAIIGTCGTHVNWSLSNGTLTIYPKPDVDVEFMGGVTMDDYNYNNRAPWQEYSADITSVVIEYGLSNIGNYSFNGLTNLQSVTLPTDSKFKHIGKIAFSGCSSLTQINLADTKVSTIGTSAFRKTGLTEITFPTTVHTLNDQVCEESPNLQKVTFLGKTTTLGNRTFSYCSALSDVTLGENFTQFSWEMFRFCTRLSSITIPAAVTKLSSNVFNGCTALTSATFENPNGWWYADESSATSGTAIPSSELADPATAATHLTTTYVGKNWKRT